MSFQQLEFNYNVKVSSGQRIGYYNIVGDELKHTLKLVADFVEYNINFEMAEGVIIINLENFERFDGIGLYPYVDFCDCGNPAEWRHKTDGSELCGDCKDELVCYNCEEDLCNDCFQRV